MTNTATVETLTAEVRTLVVGSRQITLSVAKQLDRVPLEDLAVMGRVKLRDGENLVIGAAKDGSLALAEYNPYLAQRPAGPLWISKEDLRGMVRICAKATPVAQHGEKYYSLSHGGEFRLTCDAVCPCDIEKPSFPAYKANDRESYDRATTEYSRRVKEWEAHKCDGWSASEEDLATIARLIEAHLQRHAEKGALHAAVATSPLIVLAGLK